LTPSLSQAIILSDNLDLHSMDTGELVVPEEEFSWGCWIEWEEEDIVANEGIHQIQRPNKHMLMSPLHANTMVHAQVEIRLNDRSSLPVASPHNMGDQMGA
jgi:hypothetical protein